MSEENAMFKFDFNIKETMELIGKQVVFTFTDGTNLSAKVIGFTSDKDTDSGVATIDVISEKFNACVSIEENEIISIEIK